MRVEDAHAQNRFVRAQRQHDRRERARVTGDKLRRDAVGVSHVDQPRVLRVESALLPQRVEGRFELREIGRVERVANVALDGERLEHALFGGGDAVGGGGRADDGGGGGGGGGR